MSRSLRALITLALILLAPPAYAATALTTVAIAGGDRQVHDVSLDLTAEVQGAVTAPMWYEVRAGTSRGTLIDFGAHAAASPWPFHVRHLRPGPNHVTVCALDSLGRIASGSALLTLELGPDPQVRPRPHPAEIWWGGLSNNQQLVAPGAEWEFVKRHQDGLFFHSAGYGGLTSDDKRALATLLLPYRARYWVELGGGTHPSPDWWKNQAGESGATWGAHLRDQQALGLVMSQITHDYHSENMEEFCRAFPDWPRTDLLAFFTGDLAGASAAYPYPSGCWKDAFLEYHRNNPHIKIGQTSSPVWWPWRSYAALVRSNLLYDPLEDENGVPILVNGATVSFAFTHDEIINRMVNAAREIGRPYYAFGSDCPWDYFGAWGDAAAATANREKIRSYERELQGRGACHFLICNVSNAKRYSDPDEADLYYMESSLNSMRTHQAEGGRADVYLFESWYSGIPHAACPETKPGSYTNLAMHALKFMKGIRETDGTLEELVLTASAAGPIVTFALRNAGDVACMPALKAFTSDVPDVTVRFFDEDGADVTTAAASDEGYVLTSTLAPGATAAITAIAACRADATTRPAVHVSLEAYWNVQDPTGIVRDRASVTVAPASLVAWDAEWRFWDRTTAPPANWRTVSFSDLSWSRGRAQLGFGDGDEATLVGDNGQITTYFRRTFSLSDLNGIQTLALRILRDDGAIVHLNGAEVFRSNMPAGAVTHTTPAVGAVPAEEETTKFYVATLNPAALVSGANTIAVEIHQSSATSSDLSFACELLAGFAAPASVTLTAPDHDATLPAGTVELQAQATGPLSRIEFFADGGRLGQDATAPHTYTWRDVPPGTYAVSARATDASGRVLAASFPAILHIVRVPMSFVPAGSTWKYLAGTADLGDAWRESAYNDSAWPRGPAQLGNGDGDEATAVNLGPSTARFTTVYFRHRFTCDNPTSVTNLLLRILRDDGVAVYLNNVEIFRNNLPSDPLSYDTFALTSVSNADERMWYHVAVDARLLCVGENVLAAEVHQQSATSSDLSFDCALVGDSVPPPSAVLFRRGDVNTDARIDIADPVAVLAHLFGGTPRPGCADTADGNDDGTLDIADAIALLGHLFGGAGPLAAPFPHCGDDPTSDTISCDAYPAACY